jgi:polysaccharide biosynthesis protein PslG
MYRFLARLLIFALPLAAVLALAAPPPARAVELGLVTDLTWGAAVADQEREYAALDDLGARWVRVEVNWAEVEPSRGAYHPWSLEQIDAAVRRNRAAGRQVVVMIGKAPQWASGTADHGTPPRDPADFARFAAFMARRYAADGVAGYEIWNEPNIGRFWGGRPDAAAYVALLRAAGGAIRAADPGTQIVFGGLSTNDLAYVRAAYAAGAEGLFDVMALHPYSCEARIDDVKRTGDGVIAPGSFLGYRAVRAFMVAQGDARPMWFTELGWSTTSEPCGVSEAAQAQRLESSIELMDRDPYVQAVMFYNLRNNYWLRNADTTEARYGLLTSDFRAKPAYAAFRAASAPQRLRLSVRVHRVGAEVSGRVSVGAAARVRVTLRRRGKDGHRVRVAAVLGGRFSVKLRRLGPGRWDALVELVDRPHVRAARRLVVP